MSMSLNQFLFCTAVMVAPVMGVSLMMLQRLLCLLQDYRIQETASLNARRKLIFSKTASSLSDYDSNGYGSSKEQVQSLHTALAASFSCMTHSLGTLNALKAMLFSRDGPMHKGMCFARMPVYADNRWMGTSRSP